MRTRQEEVHTRSVRVAVDVRQHLMDHVQPRLHALEGNCIKHETRVEWVEFMLDAARGLLSRLTQESDALESVLK